MKQTIAVIYVLLVVSIGFLIHFALAERSYARQIATNQAVVVQALNEDHSTVSQLLSFSVDEFPNQVSDYVSNPLLHK